MKIKYVGYNDVEYVDTLIEIIDNSINDRYSGVAETADMRAAASVKFTATIVSLLYSKGVLSKEDIGKLIDPLLAYDEKVTDVLI